VVGANPWLCEMPGNDMYQREHDLLFASIRDGKPVNDGPRMASSTLLAIMGRMAAYTGQNVTWEDAFNSEVSDTPEAWAFGEMPIPEPPTPGQGRV
jgi:myo-inositol 2-dehydrogenase/D-chiro-inositol 1-dehydrogenase